MAYTTPGAIGAWMGRVLTAEEYAYALTAADSATAFINGALARSWPGAGTITGELYPLLGSLLYLKHRPVTSITSITSRAPYVTSTARTLISGTDYRLLDAAQGIVLLQGCWQDGYQAAVTYIHTEAVPADVAEVARQLAAGILRLRFEPDRAGIKSYSLWSRDLEVQFADDAASPQLPALFAQLLSAYRMPVIA